jgi:glycosyl hydrolase family 3
MTDSSDVSERTLEEIYAPQYETAVKQGGAGAVMCSYNWQGSIKGLFEAWYPGQEDGNAIAALLFGDVDPSGRLTETFPASQSDIPEQRPAQWPGVTMPGDSVGRIRSTARACWLAIAGMTPRGSHPCFRSDSGLTTRRFSTRG